MHFFVHTVPATIKDIHIPPPVTVPLLQVSAQLQLPPVLTYSDDVLYNWAFKTQPPSNILFAPKQELQNLRCLTLFTGTRDEEEFYLSSARIELRGVEALSLMRAIMDEAFVGDAIAHRRITSYLRLLGGVVRELQALLGSVREGCDPMRFYHEIRPWFFGADSDTRGRKWVFDGLDLDPTLAEPTELSGPSAGQSALIHALDVFLGVDQYSHFRPGAPSAPTPPPPSPPPALSTLPPPLVTAPSYSSSATSDSTEPPSPIFLTPSGSTSSLTSEGTPPPTPGSPKTSALSSAALPPATPFLTRMQAYMPRHHRAFLRHLQANPRPLRALVEGACDAALRDAYDEAVSALKEFRDEHVRIVALYIVIPARRKMGSGGESEARGVPKGSGGTDAYQFVKSVRDQTAGALLGRQAASV